MVSSFANDGNLLNQTTTEEHIKNEQHKYIETEKKREMRGWNESKNPKRLHPNP